MTFFIKMSISMSLLVAVFPFFYDNFCKIVDILAMPHPFQLIFYSSVWGSKTNIFIDSGKSDKHDIDENVIFLFQQSL